MVVFGVITEIPHNLDGNRACSELIVNPDADKRLVGANIIVDPPFDEDLFLGALKFRDSGDTIIDLTKKQLLFCLTPVFTLGEIMIMDFEYGRTIPDGRKPIKWDVSYEIFDNIEDAIKRAKEVVNV